MPRASTAKKGNKGKKSLKQMQEQALITTRDNLLAQTSACGDVKPKLLTREDLSQPVSGEEEGLFHSEFIGESLRKHLVNFDQEIFIQRTMNSFAVLDKAYLEDRNIVKPVVPKFYARYDKKDKEVYALVGFATPLLDGARRASRAMAGYTPLYMDESNPDLWQMDTELVVAAVKTPFTDDLSFFGCEMPCVIFTSAADEYVVYVAQTPDPNYKMFWEATRAVWAVEAFRGKEEPLEPWEDVDLASPRPWWMNKWAMTLLRLEHHLPPDIPEDPPRRAMLGACRHARQAVRRAPKTKDEWLAIPLDKCDEGDDEWNDSYAASIYDNVECGLPTSSSWDPATKKSTTPQGTEPHPYPNEIERLKERERIYALKLAKESQLRSGVSTVAGLRRPRDFTPAPTVGSPSQSPAPQAAPQDVEM
ncbi:hypothetical protein FRC11_008631, partial [Ceratobasidium sp. 423]